MKIMHKKKNTVILPKPDEISEHDIPKFCPCHYFPPCTEVARMTTAHSGRAKTRQATL
jgi:hypothetical protein